MEYEQKIKLMIVESPLGSERRNFLRMLLGEISMKRNRADGGKAALRFMQRTNEDFLKKSRNDREGDRLVRENEILQELLG